IVNQSIFKSYDVRGVYPAELNEPAALEVGRAFARLTVAKKVVVGYDARLSSPVLFKALLGGLFYEGVEVINIGQTPTEGLYFAVANYDVDAGIMITASHNPKDYNGFKMLKKESGEMAIIRGKDLVPFIADLDNYDKFKNSALDQLNARPNNKIHFSGPAKNTKAKVQNKDILNDYLSYISYFFNKKDIKRFKIVVDASNGVMGRLIKKIKRSLPVKVIELNFKPDGNFPNHSPNPLDEGASNQIAQKITAKKADFGFMFDGDADRIFLVDERGQMVSADIVLLLLAKYFLSKNPRPKMGEARPERAAGMGIAYNLICSRSVPEFIVKWGGVPIRTQVGFVNVREGLINNNGIMGGELSAHYCFKDYWYMDSGMIAFLTLLQIISKEGKSVSEIVKELSIYAPPAQISFQIENKETVLEKVKQKYSNGKQDFLDGITVEYDNWWFNLRHSNTEPLLKLTIEAQTQELLEEKKKELSEFIKQ